MRRVCYADRLARDTGAAFAGVSDAGEDFEERALAAPIFAENAHYPAFFDG